MHSQRNEEEIILAYYRKTGCTGGRFLDIGAFDGKTFSNSLALAEAGWHGVCVEASPSAAAACRETHKDRPQVQVIQTAVGKSRGVIRLWDSPDMVSTIDDAHMAKWKSRGQYSEIWTPIVTVDDILAALATTFQFINVDTEGKTTWEIFSSLDLKKLDTRLICVEFDDGPDRVASYASKFGFHVVGQTVENLLLGK